MSPLSLPKRGIPSFVAGATALGVLLLVGWLFIARNGQTAAGAQGPSSSFRNNRVTVTGEAGYRQAQTLFRAHNYPAAISALDALGNSPTRTKADRDFLSRQRDICLRAASAFLT